MAVLMLGCNKASHPNRINDWPHWIETAKGRTCVNTSDCTFVMMGGDSFRDTGLLYIHPGDTFPEYHPWNYPDTIKVALKVYDRNGKYTIDSIIAYAFTVPEDSLDPVYHNQSLDGSSYVYNLKGEFVKYHGGRE